jgi:hypothetical protein
VHVCNPSTPQRLRQEDGEFEATWAIPPIPTFHPPQKKKKFRVFFVFLFKMRRIRMFVSTKQ